MISLIVAVSKNRVIGNDNKLCWHIPEDLKFFKEKTMNKKIIMGRKTFESLPGILPNRQHIIVSNRKDLKIDNCLVVNNYKEIIEQYKDSEEEVFVIGGKQIYELFYPFCSTLYVTEILSEFKGDTRLNLDINTDMYDIITIGRIKEYNGIKYRFTKYHK